MDITRLFPLTFVLIWATGFITARVAAGHADPLTFLALRYALAIIALSLWAILARAPWPGGWIAWRNALLAGVLMQAIYLGGVFWAVRHGLSAGITALIVGLQPLLTAVLSAPLLGEHLKPRHWLGILLGLAGVALVLSPGLLGADWALPLPALAVATLAMVGITLGTIWQKRTAGALDLRSNAAVQFIGALLATLPVIFLTEDARFDWSLPALGAVVWAAIGLSIGATSLLLFMIRRGAVAQVASLFYLTPPIAALMAYALFGEALSLVQLLGMGFAATGVAIASRA